MSFSVAMLSVHTSPLDSPGRTRDAGGMNVYMRELANELGQQNIHVDIFTRWTNEDIPRIVQLSRNVRVIHIQAGPHASISKNDLYQYLPSFAQQIEEFRHSDGNYYDVLHSHYWLSGVVGTRLAKWWDTPHVTMFHTLARLKQLAHPNEPEPQLRLETEQRLIQQVDRIITATEEERTQLIRLCAASVRQLQVIPCGVDLKLFVPHKRQHARETLGLRHPMLLFVGRLDPFKGADLLLQAATMMEEDAEIVIVGGTLTGDNDLQKLQALAADLGISHRVRFLGARPQQELPMLYSAADVTVVPSYHESFGLVAVESLACGTPVVATRAGGLTTIVHHGETGYLVPRCPGFFAERLDTLLRNSTLRARMHTAARGSVLQYSWRSVANSMHRVYKEVVSETRLAKAT
ncbi:MAG: glycosyltransferase [Chloroflexi bacterium]|nr:glycosyltransferase [Chloroflexota bacterium]